MTSPWRRLTWALALVGALALAGCGSDGGDDDGGTCDPACDAMQCMECVDGQCVSSCGDGSECVTGQCQAIVACDPACDATQCMECVAGQCVSSCGVGSECVAGECQALQPVCDPECDANACMECVDGECVTSCADGQVCVEGACQDEVVDCDPACDADACMECVEGECVLSCADGQVCVEGVCQDEVVDCDPACDADACMECVEGECVLSCADGEVCNEGVCVPDGTCDPECDASLCRECVNGECVLSCGDGEVCVEGACTPESTDCDPACDETLCQVCVDGTCTSECVEGEVCDNGECVPEAVQCDPACDASLCMECLDGACVSSCTTEEICQDGACVPTPECDPACDAGLCMVCEGTQCVTACADGETCVDGACVGEVVCDPECDAGACQECVDGTCQSTCGDNEQCEQGQCVELPPVCDPACEDNLCQECVDGACVSSCADGEVCDAGTCVPETVDCDPACDASACEACLDGACVSTCTGDETCVDGACVTGLPVFTLYELNDLDAVGHPEYDTELAIESVVVVAIDDHEGGAGNLYVMDPMGGPFSGMRVYNGIDADVSTLNVGDQIDIEGTFEIRYGLHSISLSAMELTATGVGVPAPVILDPATLGSDDDLATSYHGALVAVENVTVTIENPDGPDNDYGTFVVTGDVWVGNELMNVDPDPAEGDTFSYLSGVLSYAYGEHRIYPRSADDIVAGDPIACDPPCDALMCMECQGGECMYLCGDGEICEDGLCVEDVPGCESGCDAMACESCIDGECVSFCPADAQCVDGECVFDRPLHTLYELNDETNANHPELETAIMAQGLVVVATVAPDGNLWLMEQAGGAYSGIQVYNQNNIDISELVPGDIVDLAGTYSQYRDVNQIVLDGLMVTATGGAAPAPIVVDAAALLADADMAYSYRSVLCKVENVDVIDANPDDPSDYGEFAVTGGLRVDDQFFAIDPDPVLGDAFESITGVLWFAYGNYKLLPRDADDVVWGTPETCENPCDALFCEICVAGQCVSACAEGEVCTDGVCEVSLDCGDSCTDGQYCDEGVCTDLEGTLVSIQDVKNGTYVGCSTGCDTYRVEGLIVTAHGELTQSGDRLYVQHPTLTDYAGALVLPLNSATYDGDIAVGSVVTIVFELRDNSSGLNLRAQVIKVTGTADLPAPHVIVDAANYATDGSMTATYDGMLVRLDNATVTDANPDDPSDYNEFAVDGGLRVDDYFYLIEPDPVVGDTFSSLGGVYGYSYGNYKLFPRGAFDVVN